MTHMSYGKTARALDLRTLGHQRIEAFKVFNDLTQGVKKRHPVYSMWDGYEFSLGIYTMMMCMEWVNHRGCADKIFYKVYRIIEEIKRNDHRFTYVEPPWLKDKAVLRSHRSNLLRRENDGVIAGENYFRAFGNIDDDWPYIWPIIDLDEGYVLKISKVDRERLQNGERHLPSNVKKRIVNL